MALDPVTRTAARTPGFRWGLALIVVRIVPLLGGVLFNSPSNLIGPIILFSVCVPVGSLLVARSRSSASREWRRGK